MTSIASSWPGAGGARAGAEADPATLIRRVTLDLTGLPPTPAEVDAVSHRDRGAPSAAADVAYERVVDRLLASPHFGERWAVPWLDVARYADSNGYEKDASAIDLEVPRLGGRRVQRRHAVRSLHLEQIAGDLLPGATVAQTDRHRVSPQHDVQRRGRRRSGRGALRTPVRSRGDDGDGVAGQDARLRALPRPQARSVFAARILQPAGVLRRRTRGDAAAADRGAGAPAGRDPRRARAAASRRCATWTPALGEAQRRWERELLALPARFPALAIVSLSSTAGAPLVAAARRFGFVGDRDAGRARRLARPLDGRRRDDRRHERASTPDRPAAPGAARCTAARRRPRARRRRRVLPERHRHRGGARRRRRRRHGNRSRSRA